MLSSYMNLAALKTALLCNMTLTTANFRVIKANGDSFIKRTLLEHVSVIRDCGIQLSSFNQRKEN